MSFAQDAQRTRSERQSRVRARRDADRSASSLEQAVKKCRNCGANRERSFCGLECKNTFRRETRKRRPSTATEVIAKCGRCARDFVASLPQGGPPRRFCSLDCQRAHASANAKQPTWSLVWFVSCSQCEALFSARSALSRFCADCKATRNRSDMRRYAESKRCLALGPVRATECKRCRTEFVPTHRAREFCGARCARRWAKDQRGDERARSNNRPRDRLDRYALFESHRWHCAICECSTPSELIGTTHNRAPVRDHCIPLSAGGSDTRDNWQLLCRQCNALKGCDIETTTMRSMLRLHRDGLLIYSRRMLPQRLYEKLVDHEIYCMRADAIIAACTQSLTPPRP